VAKPDGLPLGALKKRALLNSEDASPERLSQAGREFYGLGLLTDALTFFARAKDEEGLRDVAQDAVAGGDLFLYRLAKRGLGEAPDEAELLELAENGLAAGKLVYAGDAFEEAGAHDKAAALLKDGPGKIRDGKLH
jgi:hypothetical protein